MALSQLCTALPEAVEIERLGVYVVCLLVVNHIVAQFGYLFGPVSQFFKYAAASCCNAVTSTTY